MICFFQKLFTSWVYKVFKSSLQKRAPLNSLQSYQILVTPRAVVTYADTSRGSLSLQTLRFDFADASLTWGCLGQMLAG